MKATVMIWTCVALFAGLMTGYLVGASGLKILKDTFEARVASREARVTELEAERNRLLADLAAERKEQNALMKEIVMAKLRTKELETRLEREMATVRAAADRMNEGQVLTARQVAAIARAFHDVQHAVAAGEFPGLKLTRGYAQLKAMLDNSEVERFLSDYDEVVR